MSLPRVLHHILFQGFLFVGIPLILMEVLV